MYKGLKSAYAGVRLAFLALSLLQVAGCGSPEDRAQSHYQSGTKLLAQKDFAKAAIEFKSALKLKGDLIGAWRGLSQIEERNQNWEGLGGILRKIVELDPQDVAARLRIAKLMLLAGSLDEALKMVNAASDLDGRNAGALALKAVILLKLNDSSGALREAQAALEIEPTNVEALIVLGGERLERGDIEGALSTLNRAPAAVADNFGIQLFKIKIYERMGDQQQIESLLRKFVELYPKENAFRGQLIRFLVEQKRPGDAEKELRAVAAANPTDIGAGLDVVRFLNSFKGSAAARQELTARINAGGRVLPYQIALAEMYFAEGNVTDSVLLLEKLASSAASADDALAAQIKLAELHLSSKKFDAAETLVSKILSKDSRNASGLRLRAALHVERGRLDAAIADLRTALNDQPRSAELMLLLAIAYERSGSIELADKQFADSTRVSNFDASVGLNYVAFLRRRGSVARAEDILTELAGRWPSDIAVLSALAEVRLARKNWVGAQEIADTIRRIGNDRGISSQILAAALSGGKKLDESIGILQTAATASQGAVQPMFALVNTLIRAQKIDRAIGFLQTVLQKDAGNAEALVLLGSAQLAKSAPDQALKSFQTAIERQPKNIVGYQALADLYLMQGKIDEALGVIRAALHERPENFAMRLALASALEQKRDFEAAIAEYEDLLKQQSGSMIVANNLASLLSDNRTDKASLERAYALAVSLRKSPVPQFKDTLGWIHYQRGEYKTAVSLLEEAATELPTVGEVSYHLGMGYLAAGEPAKASEKLKKALELASTSTKGELEEKIRVALQRAGNL